MNEPMTRIDRLVAAALFGVALMLRVPFRSTMPYHWDCAEFALAIRDYNIVHSQPHAPGYFLYVMLGRCVNCFVGDPHASLVWLSVVAGGLLVAVMYGLGMAMFDRRTALIAALLAITGPQTWFHSEVALTYIVDALLVSVTVWMCWQAMQRGGTWGDAVWIGAMLAVVGGVRQQSVPALAPVVLYSFWNFERARFAKLAAAAAAALALGLMWFVPMVSMSGGLGTYLEIVRRHAMFNAPATFSGGGFDALVWNIFFASLFCLNGLMLAAVVIVVPILGRTLRWRARSIQLLAVWVGGMWVMASVVGFTKQPGYVLNLLPGLFLLAASALAQWRWPFAAMVCAVNVVAFVTPAFDGLFHGTARTAGQIRQRDRQLRDAVAAIRQQCNPADTVVCHAGEYLHFGLKQFQLLLPDYDQIQLLPDPTMLSPPGKPLMAVRDGRLHFVSGPDWTGKTTVALIVPPDLTAQIFERYQIPAGLLRKVIHE